MVSTEAIDHSNRVHSRLHRTTESQQGQDAGNRLGRFLAAIEDRPLGLHKRLIARLALVPLLLLTMNPDVTLIRSQRV
jgi:hypothetical protein